MISKGYVHLHNHTSYSRLDGAAKIDELVKAAREDGQPSLASTDHGNLWGLIEFYKTCKDGGVEPILGIEAYFCDDQKERGGKSGHGHIDGSDKRYYHLTVLAENNTGYQNLIKLSSDAFLEGFYYQPRTDWNKLEQFSDGLIVTTGCLGGPVLQELLHDNFDAALQKTARLQDIFGRDNLFVELQDHGLVEQAKTNPMLIDIARKLNAPLLATNDLHYVKHEDWIAHDSLLCCQTGARRSDEKRFKFQSDQHYLKSAAEMRALFATIPEACDNTLWVAERCNVELEVAPYAKPLHLPVFAVPSGFEDATQYLAHLAFAGLRERYGDPTEEQVERLVYELQVLDTLGLSAYMLIVWDLVKFADREGIRRGAARGSVAGSLCAYCLDISKVDPLRHNLMFERFLNPDRVALPDIDLDFDTRYRDSMLEYTRSKYGEDQVAQIITFSKIGARTAVRDSARVLGYDTQLANEISKAMPDLVMGEATPLKYCFEESPRYETGYKNAEGLRNLHAANPQVREVVDVALGLEGLVRQDGVHAAGVLITPGPLTDYVPIQKKPDGPITTQYEKNALEDLGLVKMDFLGLRNLDVISKTLDLLGFDPGVEDTTFNDPKTFTLLQRGNTIGVFQLEGKGIRTLLQRLKPTSIDDIAAAVALYRPGPMGSGLHLEYADRKNVRKPIEFFHEDAEDILKDTYGITVYQEQIMQIAQRFAGYTPGEADSLRKIVGRKLIDKMKAERDKFVGGCRDNGYSDELADSLFKMIEHHASYSFNQSHAYGYGYITYQTAYLKANYPKEYMAALCSSLTDDIEKCAVMIAEARRMGLEIHNPDINKSLAEFSAEEDGLRVGLSAVRYVGFEAAEKIVSQQPYGSLMDFVLKNNPNARAFESLALAGAFSEFGTRLGVSSVIPEVLKAARKKARKVPAEQMSLLDEDALWAFDLPQQEFPPEALFEKEFDALGLYVSGHPLDAYTDQATDWTVADLEHAQQKQTCELLVQIVGVKRRRTVNGDDMAILQVQDQTGTVEIVCFPKAFARTGNLLEEDAIGLLKVRAGMDRMGGQNYILEEFSQLGSAIPEDVDMSDFKLFLPKGFINDEAYISKLKGLLLSHHGNLKASLYVSRNTRVELPVEFAVDGSEALMEDLKRLFVEFASR